VKTLFASKTTVNSSAASPSALLVLSACFLFSGFAGIVYQIAWARQLAVVFGTTEVAVALVLAGYMAGLALGAWLIQRFLPFVERPVLTYAALELLIAITAIFLVPTVVTRSDWLLRSLAGQQPEPPGGDLIIWLFYAGAAFAALVIPTLCMGATLPLLTRQIVESDRQTGSRVGLLFTFNTAGAVGGALAATYWMLPSLGLTRTVWAAAAINVLTAVFSLTVSRRVARRRSGFSAAWAAASRARFSRPPSPAWVLPLMLFSGAVALFHEVLWTRLLTHVLGSSLHAFGITLASFLAGLALGAAVGALLAQDKRAAVPGFAISQTACALAAAAAYVLVNRVLPDRTALVSSTLLTATILLPIAFFSGATFPLAVRILARRAEDAAPATARVYAWNTLGAIAGALLGGFALIPLLRFEGSIRAAVLASLVLAVCASLLLQRPSRVLVISVAVVAAATVAMFSPPVPLTLLRSSPLHISNAGRVLYYGIGQSASVIVLEQDGALAIRTNGLPEALVQPRGAPPQLSGEKWLVPAAILTQPQAKSLLVVGYGGGVVLEDVPESVERIDVVELEPRVIDANVAIRSLRKRDPLPDRRVRVVINDARVALNLTDRRYDAIVSQPSHPWTAAASHLYTREFLLQARAHLAEHGAFVQWMNLTFIDEQLLRSFAATLLDVFGDARLYRPDPFTLVFVAMQQRADQAEVTAFPRLGINTPEDFFVALAADGQALRRISRGAPLITDDQNRMATQSAYRLGSSMTPATADRFLAPYDPLRLRASFASGLDQGAVARRLANLSPLNPGLRNRLDTFANALDASSESAYEVNAEKLTLEGDPDAAQELLKQGLARYPANEKLRFEYVKPWLTRLARGTATPEITAQAAKLTGSADAVVRGSALASRQQWSELSALDEALATATWRDPWKLDAIVLQAEWRYQQQDTGDLPRQRAEEALEMLDEAIAAQPAIVLYALRLQSALAAHRPDAVVESIWTYGHGLFADASPSVGARADPPGDAERSARRSGSQRQPLNSGPPESTSTRAALTELVQLLNKQTGADTARIEEVRDGLQNDLRELSR
jgi:spermidine synthase